METEVRVLQGIEVDIITDVGTYRAGLDGIKVETSRFASVTKQLVQFSRAFLR